MATGGCAAPTSPQLVDTCVAVDLAARSPSHWHIGEFQARADSPHVSSRATRVATGGCAASTSGRLQTPASPSNCPPAVRVNGMSASFVRTPAFLTSIREQRGWLQAAAQRRRQAACRHLHRPRTGRPQSESLAYWRISSARGQSSRQFVSNAGGYRRLRSVDVTAACRHLRCPRTGRPQSESLAYWRDSCAPQHPSQQFESNAGGYRRQRSVSIAAGCRHLRRPRTGHPRSESMACRRASCARRHSSRLFESNAGC